MNESAQGKIKPRRAWLAAVLSLLLPGLGQLYNRDVRVSLLLLAVAVAITGPGLWLIASMPTAAAAATTMLFTVVSIAFLLFGIAHAAIRARRLGAISLAWFNRWFVYVGLIVLFSAWREVVPMLPIPSIESYSTPSGSMIPTLLVGDNHEARTRAFDGRQPERGEIAVFESSADPADLYLARVIGLPGDRIQLREGRLYINDVLVDRTPLTDQDAAPLVEARSDLHLYRETLPGSASYLIAEVDDSSAMDNTPEYLVPADHVFMLGDNRDRSNDSRADRGFVPFRSLRDKPILIYWSRDLSRIGKVVE